MRSCLHVLHGGAGPGGRWLIWKMGPWWGQWPTEAAYGFAQTAVLCGCICLWRVGAQAGPGWARRKVYQVTTLHTGSRGPCCDKLSWG